MMKAVLVLILTFQMGFASASDNPNLDMLEKHYKSLKDKFPAYANATYLGLMRGYYNGKLQDFLLATDSLARQAGDSISRFQAAQSRWNALAASALVGDQGGMDSAVQMAGALAALDREARSLQTIAGDFPVILAAWSDRCGETRLEYAKSFFRPKALIPIDNLDFTPQAANYTVGVSVSMSFSGQVGSSSTFGSNSTDDAIAGTAMAVGSCFGPIGAAIGAVVGTAFLAIMHAARYVNELNQQYEMLEKIRKVQIDTVDGLEQGADGTVRKECTDGMPDSLPALEGVSLKSIWEKNASSIAGFASQAAAFVKEAGKQFQIVQSQYADRLEQLEGTYFERLEEDFLASLRSEFEELGKLDEKAREFRIKTAVPLLSAARKARHFEERIQARQALWSALIAGENAFNPKADYAFLSGGSTACAATDVGSWASTAKLLCAEMVK